jgi:hypothetical protein
MVCDLKPNSSLNLIPNDERILEAILNRIALISYDWVINTVNEGSSTSLREIPELIKVWALIVLTSLFYCVVSGYTTEENFVQAVLAIQIRSLSIP